MKNKQLAFAVTGSLMTIFFLIIVNMLTTPDDLWFMEPTISVLQWPLILAFAARGKIKQFALYDSLLIIAFLFTENRLYSPDHPWFLYAACAIVWWPILMFAGKFAKTFAMSVIGSAGVIVSYVLLNVYVSPEFPWAMFPAFVVLWWPLAIYCGLVRQWFLFSVLGTLLSSVFFIALNAVTTTEIWAIYPIFAIAWWPLSMFYYSRSRTTA